VFTREEDRTAEQEQIVALSDSLTGELARADVIVIGTPMYNYGMPSALEAWAATPWLLECCDVDDTPYLRPGRFSVGQRWRVTLRASG